MSASTSSVGMDSASSTSVLSSMTWSARWLSPQSGHSTSMSSKSSRWPDAWNTGSGVTVGESISMFPSRVTKRSRHASSMLRFSAAPSGPYV